MNLAHEFKTHYAPECMLGPLYTSFHAISTVLQRRSCYSYFINQESEALRGTQGHLACQ